MAMEIPEKAPDWRRFVNENRKSIFDLSKILEPGIKKANREYLYWEQIQFYSCAGFKGQVNMTLFLSNPSNILFVEKMS